MIVDSLEEKGVTPKPAAVRVGVLALLGGGEARPTAAARSRNSASAASGLVFPPIVSAYSEAERLEPQRVQRTESLGLVAEQWGHVIKAPRAQLATSGRQPLTIIGQKERTGKWNPALAVSHPDGNAQCMLFTSLMMATELLAAADRQQRVTRMPEIGRGGFWRLKHRQRAPQAAKRRTLQPSMATEVSMDNPLKSH